MFSKKERLYLETVLKQLQETEARSGAGYRVKLSSKAYDELLTFIRFKMQSGVEDLVVDTSKDTDTRFTLDRASLLEALPEWDWGSPGDAQARINTWLNRYEEVRTFIHDFGHMPSSRSNDPTEARLADWCKTQRQFYWYELAHKKDK